MIKALSILRTVRHKEGDNNEVKYSDYDITEALNEVLRYLSTDLANKQAEYLCHTRMYDEQAANDAIRAVNEANAGVDGYEPVELEDYRRKGAELPENFVTLVEVRKLGEHYALRPAVSFDEVRRNKYYVAGGRLYVPCQTFAITYYGRVESVKDIEVDSIDLPDIFYDTLVKLTRVVLNNGDNDTLTQAVNLAVAEAIPKRRWHNMQQKMPFYL